MKSRKCLLGLVVLVSLCITTAFGMKHAFQKLIGALGSLEHILYNSPKNPQKTLLKPPTPVRKHNPPSSSPTTTVNGSTLELKGTLYSRTFLKGKTVMSQHPLIVGTLTGPAETISTIKPLLEDTSMSDPDRIHIRANNLSLQATSNDYSELQGSIIAVTSHQKPLQSWLDDQFGKNMFIFTPHNTPQILGVVNLASLNPGEVFDVLVELD